MTYPPGRLSCLRGISTLTAFTLAVEIGNWDRFTGAGIGAYPGLVPSEHLMRVAGLRWEAWLRQRPAGQHSRNRVPFGEAY